MPPRSSSTAVALLLVLQNRSRCPILYCSLLTSSDQTHTLVPFQTLRESDMQMESLLLTKTGAKKGNR